MSDIFDAIYDWAVDGYRRDLKRYIKEVAEDERNFKYLIILTCKAGDSPDFILVGQGGELMIAEKESVYKTFDTDRYIIKYPVEINGIEKVIDLRKERAKIKKEKEAENGKENIPH